MCVCSQLFARDWRTLSAAKAADMFLYFLILLSCVAGEKKKGKKKKRFLFFFFILTRCVSLWAIFRGSCRQWPLSPSENVEHKRNYNLSPLPFLPPFSFQAVFSLSFQESASCGFFVIKVGLSHMAIGKERPVRD